MLLEAVEATNFRNLGGKIEWGNGLNILFGENGQGKTNWLEAVYFLATTRSFRTAKLSEAVRFSEGSALVGGRVRRSEDISRDLRATIEGNIKTFSVNGKRETVQRYLGELHAIVFNADELSIVRGSPENRRRFLDDGIVSLHPPFVQTFTDLNKVVRQKNSLLQTARDREYSLEKTAELLVPWNEQLAGLAARVHRGRVRYIERLNEVLERKLFGKEEITIRHASSLEGKGDLSDYENLIAERLKLRVQAELAAGHCLIGPQRDDMEISFDGHDLRRFGSSGQQRSALLALLLANISVFEATRGEYPLFMLDDIDAELDHKRIGHLLDYLSDKTQTIVTTSKAGFIEDFGSQAAVFSVRRGVAETQAKAVS